MKDSKRKIIDIRSKKMSSKDIENDSYLSDMSKRREDRLKKTREKLAKEPMPEKKQPETESQSDFINRNNGAVLRQIRDKRILKFKKDLDKPRKKYREISGIRKKGR